jgi:hypothetical protein
VTVKWPARCVAFGRSHPTPQTTPPGDFNPTRWRESRPLAPRGKRSVAGCERRPLGTKRSGRPTSCTNFAAATSHSGLTSVAPWLTDSLPEGSSMRFRKTCERHSSRIQWRWPLGETSRRWRATSSFAGWRMPNRRQPGSAAFAELRRSWRRASADPVAGQDASTASETAGSRRVQSRILASSPAS